MALPGQAFIDNEILIKEIKKRPLLYDRSMKEYNNLQLKKKTWTEVCEKVLHEYWSSWDKEKKEHVVQQIQKRWANLKNCFIRELRTQKAVNDQKPTKRRKYIYFDQMAFLLDTESKSNVSNDDDSRHDDDSRTDFEQTQEFEEDDFDETRDVRSIKGEQAFGEEIFLFPNPLNATTANPLQSTSGKDNASTIDQDVNFAMSIVPMLRVLPMNTKLDIQIEILKLFKKVIQS